MDIPHEYGYLGFSPSNLPMKHDLDFIFNKSSPLKDPSMFNRLIGKLIYLTITHPNIYFVVQNLSQFLDNPSTYHWEASFKILKYLKKSPTQGITYYRDSPLTLSAYYDSE